MTESRNVRASETRDSVRDGEARREAAWKPQHFWMHRKHVPVLFNGG